jgi:hypothetical protein
MSRRFLSGFAAAGLLAVGAAGALAAEDILLEDGRVVRGDILEVREDGLRVKGRPKEGGVAEMVIRADLLDAEWYYGLRDKAAGEDAKSHLKLAMWCVEKGLFSRAQAQIHRAAELDPKLVKDIREGTLPGIREGIAAKVLASARADEKAGRVALAQEKVELLLARMPDTPAGAEAADYLPDIEAKAAEKEAKDQADARAKLAEEERKAEEARDRLLAPVEETLKKGKALASRALAEDNQPQAIEMLGQALQMGEACIDTLEAIAKEKSGDGTLAPRVAELQARITASMIKGYLHKAEMYMWRGSLPNAKAEIAKVEKLDPGNTDAASLADRIEDTEKGLNDEQRWRRGGPGGDSRFGGRRGGGGGGGGRR